MRILLSTILATALSIGATTSFAAIQSNDAGADLDRASKDYLNYYMSIHPIQATGMGIHDYDALLPDWSKPALKKEESELSSFAKRFEAINPNQLDTQKQIDRQLAINDIKATLLDLQQVKMLEKNPKAYSETGCDAVYSIIKRPYAPLPTRMELATKRMAGIPKLIEQGKQNLANVPKIYAEITLEEMDGSLDFFKKTAPEAFAAVKDKKLNEDFHREQKRTIASLENYKAWLKQEVLPHSVANFAIGKENYQSKLAYEEMVSTPVDELLAQGYDELRRLQNDFTQVGKSIDPSKPAAEVYSDLSKQHPQPDQLLSATTDCLDSIRQFCVDKKIVTIPSRETLKVEDTPEFDRALSFASMDTAGPFEKVARDSYYYVTPAEPTWSKEKIEQHMRFFSNNDLINTSVHEVYPGHYVQFLWIRQAPSKLRQVLGCGSNAEGWAHYCEEMMVDQGLGDGDKGLKMIQLHDALLRACRYIVGIQMHTKGMTLDEAIAFFMKEGYQEKANAERESKRGTMDPTYLVYTLGKLQIKQLRSDYQAKMGDKYTLQDFHDKFLAQGCPPVKLVRQALLGN